MQYEDIENDSRPVQYTIAKYFNRAKFRPTPYGTFASIGIGELGSAGEFLIVNEKMSRKRFKDWDSIISAQNQWRHLPFNTLFYRAELLQMWRSNPMHSEWLYFELFMHPGKANEVLLNGISKILEKIGDLIKRWFFIRYDAMGSHLRLRFQLTDVSSYEIILERMHELFTRLKVNGFLKDAKICTYERELERYAADIMEQVEDLFCRDSKYVMQIFNALPGITTMYLNTIQLIIAVGDAVFGKGELQGILTKLVNAHNTEHLLGTSEFKVINNFYKREIKARSTETGSTSSSEIAKVYINILLPLVRKHQIQLFADLFHMHINRLFADHQREHETLIYNFALSKIKEMQYLKPALAF